MSGLYGTSSVSLWLWLSLCFSALFQNMDSRHVPQTHLQQQEESEDTPSSSPTIVCTTQMSPSSQYEFKTWNEGNVTKLTSELKGALSLSLYLEEDNENLEGFDVRKSIRLKLMDAIATSNTLTYVNIRYINYDEIDVLCRSLGANTVLQHLVVHMPEGFGDDGAKLVCEMLKTNSTLKYLVLNDCEVGAIGAAFLGTMLSQNSTLERLWLVWNPLGPEGVECLLQPLMPNGESGHQLNTSLTSLLIDGSFGPMGSRGAQCVAETLNGNRTLTHLGMMHHNNIAADDVCMILKSLENNISLQMLNLSNCTGVEGDRVFATLMDLLEVNNSLTEIQLEGTGLQREGRDRGVRTKLQRNAQEYTAFMRELPVIQPMSARIFLCGHAFSGKTTLGRSMARSLATDVNTKMVRPFLDLIELHKSFGGCLTDPNEWTTRTRGIEIKILRDDGKRRISIWDLAGQEEYHAFHDLMIPDLSTQGSPCCFLLLCSAFDRESGQQKQSQMVKQELCYWLRFIASNTQRSITSRPQVTVVLTHCDKPFGATKLVEEHVNKLKRDFENYLNLSSNMYFLNAHSSRGVKDLADNMHETCMNILERLPKVYEACVDMRNAVLEWNKEHSDRPMITKEMFNAQIIQEKVPSLHLALHLSYDEQKLVEKRRKVAALCLHEAGEIIYFDEEGANFVVVNPQWFCQGVMGQIIQFRKHMNESTETSGFKNGFANKEHLKFLLENSLQHKGSNSCFGKGANLKPLDVEPQDLIQLMLQLGLCYEKNPSEDLPSNSTFFIPTTLMDYDDDRVSKGERKLQWHWKSHPWEASIIYVGRRLVCRDQELTTLTPAFFPKLQVHLHNHVFSQLRHKSPIYKNEKNLVRVILDGMEMLVELSGDMMGCIFIDVLVKSSKSHKQTLDVVHKHVVSQVQDLCSSPQGCVGVVLVEGILRPQCVEKLLLCKHRKEQIVMLETLKEELLAASLDPLFVHPFSQVIDGESEILGVGCSDLAVDLLGEMDTEEVLKRRLSELGKLDADMDQQLFSGVEQDVIDDAHMRLPQRTSQSTLLDIKRMRSMPTSRYNSLQDIESLIKDEGRKTRHEVRETGRKVVNEVKENIRVHLESMENRLQRRLYMNLDQLINLSFQLRQRLVPCNFFLTTKGTSLQRKLIVKLLPGYSVVQLYLLCEHRDSIHAIKDQKGAEVLLVTENARKYVRPLIVGSLTILSLLVKVGAHIVAGIGDMVPNVGKGVALALDAQCFSEFLPTNFNPTLEPLQMQTKMSEEASMADEKCSAEQWLVDFLKGRNIFDTFSLSRVRYIKGGSEHPQIRWVCKDHREEGKRNGILEDLPV